MCPFFKDTLRTTRVLRRDISVVGADGDMHPVGSDWGSFLAWTRQPAASWFHASNLGGDRFYELADAAETLIELHVNFKSFEMNAFLKLLAIVSFLGLIPSVAGGLLGMNVAGNPWPVTLGQVAFGVAMGMATALYVFAVKGWLKQIAQAEERGR